MTIAIIAAIIIYILYRVRKNQRLLEEKRYYDSIIDMSSQDKRILLSKINTRMSNNIIDISGEGEQLPRSRFYLEKYSNGVPFWDFLEVNSYHDLYTLDLAQLDFYSFFKKDFLKGFYYDLEGNYNYALLLAYDLADEFERDQELMVFSKRMKKLAAIYPKVGETITLLLLKKIVEYGNKPVTRPRETLDDIFSKPNNRIEKSYTESRQDNYDNYNNYNNEYRNSYDYNYWKLGGQYRSTFNLTNEQVKLLNYFYPPSNNFFKIEFCAKEIIFLYLAVIAQFDKNLEDEGLKRKQLFEEIAGEIAKKQFRYRKGSYNYKNCVDNVPSDIYATIFRLCENAVREHYDHKRKLTIDGYSKPKAQEIFQEKILSKVEPVIASMVQTVKMPDEATEQELNAQNKTRWKITFEQLKKTHTHQPAEFEKELVALGERNKKNTSAENIFFDAAKYMAAHHKTTALRLYIRYLSYDTSRDFRAKPLTKKALKQIFKKSEQQTAFENIAQQFRQDKNLETAFSAIEGIFKIKRKTIQLDRKRIEAVKSKHADTVDLLNEYLQDEELVVQQAGKIEPIVEQENQVEQTEKTLISQPQEANNSTTFNENLSLEPAHIKLLQLFEANNFELSPEQMEIFVQQHGLPKNIMINAINDVCLDLLEGDALIEEEEDKFVVFDEYFEMLK